MILTKSNPKFKAASFTIAVRSDLDNVLNQLLAQLREYVNDVLEYDQMFSLEKIPWYPSSDGFSNLINIS